MPGPDRTGRDPSHQSARPGRVRTWVNAGILDTVPENRRQNAHAADGALLDGTDRLLLAELQADARLSLAELGRRVGLSSPAVSDRLQRLEREQVILGYHDDLNPRALGMSLSAVIRVRPA